ncbi:MULTISPECIES: YlxR family protein [Leucobacter]|uniref:YlxR domain-containing protein n=1 Tax=Leucobacter iarius TaxID=333963 RepID=A0ABP4XZB5_9MICO|nr:MULTISPECIES: YlxR family protein [unclassified Leucobacter]PII88739.1 nucleic-acid-binding protein [Leucobacter sp. OLTLW20]PII90903.1 nucleic-acid-binding protein [Leucobacter sp. OLAS13]PII97650.1 nucleic-acid-binding protein [Leucobacter sp. OLDS2]PII98889.1 nucleic-acid-binding protein [Leucobacter sp. OLCS4]PIJ05404.1 nucleic-acid-binding protein [Leucobacter sp. OLIS6]
MVAVRTCVACRQRAERAELLRVVLRGGRLMVDERAVLPGRGAWVHPTRRCLELAVSRGSFARALRASGKPDASPLENRLKTLMDN